MERSLWIGVLGAAVALTGCGEDSAGGDDGAGGGAGTGGASAGAGGAGAGGTGASDGGAGTSTGGSGAGAGGTSAGAGGDGTGGASAGSGGASCRVGGDECFHPGAFLGRCVRESSQGHKTCAEYYEPTPATWVEGKKGACEQGGKGTWSTTERCPTSVNGLDVIGCCSTTNTQIGEYATGCRYALDPDGFWHRNECDICAKHSGVITGCFTNDPPAPGAGSAGTGGSAGAR